MNMVQEKSEQDSKIILPRESRPATTKRHNALRDDLLARATRIIATNGLAQLRARDLALEAGCSVGAIYNVFADFDALILAVNAGTLAELDATMAAITAPTPLAHFLAMADAYLTYAVENRLRWDALFNHRMPLDAETPDWFRAIQDKTFSHIETPLADIRPDLSAGARHLLGRSIFAAVHGMVALGVDQRLAPLGLTALRAQISVIVTAIAHGLPLAAP
jgi:AcrR family transcriptional regulator